MKNYLVIQLARFGDLIQTKRLVKTLCTRRDAQVHLCVDISLKPLAQIIYPSVKVHAVKAHGTGAAASGTALEVLLRNRRTFSELQAVKFDTVYNLNFSPLNFRMAALFDADQVEGYSWRNGQEITSQWPAMAMRWSGFRRLGINLVDFWAGYCPDMITPEDVNPVASPQGGGIGVVLAGRESRRSLPPDLLARMTTTVARTQKSQRIVLLGGDSEKAAGQSVLKSLPTTLQNKTENLAGKTDWAELVELVSSLDMLLTPDTGTMHLAAHLGVPVAAFFLSSAWCFETGPYGKGHTVYQAVTECLPCLETQPCPFDVKCRNGFSDPNFQRFLATGKPEHAPSGVLAMRSTFDELGQIYTPYAGTDQDAKRRNGLRSFIRQFLAGGSAEISQLDSEFANQFFREKDWMTESHSTITNG